MKPFWKVVFGGCLGTIIAFLLVNLIFFWVIGAAVSSIGKDAEKQPAVPRNAILKIDLSNPIAERTKDDVSFNLLAGSADLSKSVSLLDAVQALELAAADPQIRFVYLKADELNMGIAQAEEFRSALMRFRESGKPVISYSQNLSGGTYYLASVADKVILNAYGDCSIVGLNSMQIYYKDLIDHLGVDIQLIRHGKYKSAGEMYTRATSSPENREQNQRMIDSIWETIGTQIAEARGISLEELDRMIEGLEINFPQDLIDRKLADELLDREGLENKLATLAVVDKFEDIKWISFADYVEAKLVPSKAKQKIAVIYADGEIIDGSAKSNVAGDRFASVISKVRADSTVKAVVLRVNSPGGSVFASEKIKAELDLLKADKPIVASYGDYAASGGYWISNNCEKIYSDATTLTGSIGVFGMIPDLSKTIKDFAHVGVESVTSHKHGDMYSLMRPFDSDEYNYMLASIETIYDRFTTTVSEGRGIPKETVDAIGQGRVWTGADALQINLVDEIGTLEDAIRYAAVAAGDPDLAQWNVKGYPAPPSMMEQLFDAIGKNSGNDNALVAAFKRFTSPQILARMDNDIRIK